MSDDEDISTTAGSTLLSMVNIALAMVGGYTIGKTAGEMIVGDDRDGHKTSTHYHHIHGMQPQSVSTSPVATAQAHEPTRTTASVTQEAQESPPSSEKNWVSYVTSSATEEGQSKQR